MSGAKPHLDEWQLFSVRHGRAPIIADRPSRPWAGRHRAVLNDDLAPERIRCACPGGLYPGEYTSCLIAATQEDFLCDECRQWCVCVDDAGNFHLIIDKARSRAESQPSSTEETTK